MRKKFLTFFLALCLIIPTIFFFSACGENPVITLDYNGATGGNSVTSITVDDGQMGTLPTPTKTGYNFDGWYLSADFSGSQASESSQITGSITLFAKWTAKTTSLTLNANSGIGGETGAITATFDAVLPTFSLNTKTGYTLQGYYTAATAGTKVINADRTLVASVENYTSSTSKWANVDEAVTLYAQYTANTTAITLDKNTGADNSSATATYDSTTLPSFTAVLRTGYNLKGYYTLATDGVKIINSDGTLVANVTGYTDETGKWTRTDSTLTLFAQWTAKTTSLTLKANYTADPAIEDRSSIATYDGTTISSFTAFTRSNYTLAGYYTDASAGVKVVNADGTLVANVTDYTADGKWAYSISNTLNLFAHWTPVQYPVSFTAGTNVEEIFVALAPTATSGSASGTNLDFASTQFLIIKLPVDTAQYSYSADGFTKGATVGSYTYFYKSITIGATNALGTIDATQTTNRYAVTFIKGENVGEMFIALTSTATSGDISGTEYDYGTTVYAIIKITDTEALTFEIPTGYTNVSGTDYYYKEIASIAADQNLGTVNATSSTRAYPVTFTKGENLESMFLTTTNSVESGVDRHTSGVSFNYNTSIYVFIELKNNTDEFTYSAPAGYTQLAADSKFYSKSITIGTTNELGTVSAVQETNQYPVTFTKGDYVEEMFIALTSTATTGDASETEYNYGATIYAIIKLLADDLQYDYTAPSGYTQVESSLYYYKSITIGASNALGTIAAQREIKQYDVTFVVSGEGYGTLSSSTIEDVPYGSIISINENVLTIGTDSVTATSTENTAQYTYSFTGWSVEHGAATADSTSITASFSRVAKSYDLTYDYEGATGGNSETKQTATYLELLSTLPTPTREHYTFGGWYTEDNGTGLQLTSNTSEVIASVEGFTDADKKWLKAEAVIVYANWTLNSNPVAIELYYNNDPESDSMVPATSSILSINPTSISNTNYGDTIEFTLTVGTGYEFASDWNDNDLVLVVTVNETDTYAEVYEALFYQSVKSTSDGLSLEAGSEAQLEAQLEAQGNYAGMWNQFIYTFGTEAQKQTISTLYGNLGSASAYSNFMIAVNTFKGTEVTTLDEQNSYVSLWNYIISTNGSTTQQVNIANLYSAWSAEEGKTATNFSNFVAAVYDFYGSPYVEQDHITILNITPDGSIQNKYSFTMPDSKVAIISIVMDKQYSLEIDGYDTSSYFVEVMHANSNVDVAGPLYNDGYDIEGFYFDSSYTTKIISVTEGNYALVPSVAYGGVNYTDADGKWIFTGETAPKVYINWTPKTVS